MSTDASIEDLIGKTLVKAENLDNDEIIFTCSDGSVYRMFHMQDCCESVTVDDIIGDLNDLVGSPIITASADSNEENPDGVQKDYQDSFTWTFYNLSTIKGYVTIRWYGESNGYYSESVDFVKTK